MKFRNLSESSVDEITKKSVKLNGSEHPQSAFDLAPEVDQTEEAHRHCREELEGDEFNED